MKKKTYVVLFLLAMSVLQGCSMKKEENRQDADSYQIYSVSREETEISAREFQIEKTSVEKTVDALLEQLKSQPEDTAFRAAIPTTLLVTGYSITDNTLTLNFGDEYDELTATGEVLSRAAIVKTLCQTEGINYVVFTVEGNALRNGSGNLVGLMSADQFMDDRKAEINSYEKANLTLYYADEYGTHLRAYKKEVVYNSNISVEKLVVEQLIQGPDDTTMGYPTINPDTKVVSVTVKDGTCYVNLDDTFLTQVYSTSAEVTIYSLVNSLVELPDINKVQVSVSGKTDVALQETMPLSKIYERNLEIIY